MHIKSTLAIIAFLLWVPWVAQATIAGNSLVYEGVLLDSTSTPVAGTKTFRVTIQSGGTTVLQQTIPSVTVSNGNFRLSIDGATGTFTWPSTPQNMTDLFLASGSKTLIIEIQNGASTYDAFAALPIQVTPYAFVADSASKLGTFASTNVLRAVDVSGNPVTAPAFDPTQLGNLTSLIAGTSTQYTTATQFGTVQAFAKTALPTCTTGQVLKSDGTTFSCVTDSTGTGTVSSVSSANAYLSVATGTTTPALTLNVGTAANTVAAGNDSRITGALQSGAAAGGSLAGTFPNPTIAAGVITNNEISATAAIVDTKLATISTAGKVSGSAITSGTIGGSTAINTSGNIRTTGSLQVFDAGPTNSVSIKAPASVTTSYNLTLPSSTPTPGQILASTDALGTLSWISPSASSGGTVTSITAGTGLTGGTITSSGTIGLGTELLGLNSVATTGYVKRTAAGAYSASAVSLTADVSGILPINSGGTGTSTALNSNRLMISSAGAIVEAAAMSDGQIVVGKTGSAPQLVVMSGDAAVSNTGAVTVSKINGTAVSGIGLANTNLLQNNSGAAIGGNSVLVSNSIGTGVTSLTSPASGILTSTGTVPAWTSSLPATQGGTGFTSYAIGDLLYASSTSALSKLSASTSGMVLTSNGAGTAPSWQTVSSALPTLPSANIFVGNASNVATAVAPSGVLTMSNTGAFSLGANAVTDGNILSITSPGKIAMTAVSTGNGISVASVTGASSKGISIPAVTNGTGISVAGVTAAGTGISVAVAAAGTNPGMNISSLSTTADAVDISNTAVGGTALWVSSGLTSVQGMLATQYQSAGGGTASAPMYTSNLSSTTGLFFPAANLVGFSTSGSERMRIDAAGYVGLNTTAPSSLLDINGAITNRGMAAPAVPPAGQGRIYFDSTSNTYKVSQNGGAYVDMLSAGSNINDSQITNTVSRTANTFLAGPTAASGPASYRSIASADLPSLSTGMTGTLPVANGGTGSSNFTAGGVLVGNGTSSVQSSVAGSTGQFLVSSGAGLPTWATIQAGSGINLTNSAGTITISNSGLSGTGTTGKIPKMASANSIADSSISDNGTIVSMTGGLAVTGNIVSQSSISSAATSVSGTNFDFATGGNLQYTTNPCGNFTLANLVSGGTYEIVVQNVTGTCAFTSSADTIHYNGGVTNVPITSHTIFTFLKAGTHVYVTWVSF